MKSVAKKTNIGAVPRSSAHRHGASQPPSAPVAGFTSLRTDMNPNTSARTANRSGVQRSRVPSIAATASRPDAFCNAAAA